MPMCDTINTQANMYFTGDTDTDKGLLLYNTTCMPQETGQPSVESDCLG